MAAENVAQEGGQTAGEYIIHHLHFFQSSKPTNVVDFTVFNYDSIFFSVLMGVIGCWLLWLAARKATSGAPGRFQAAVEILVEMVDGQAKSLVHNATSRKFVAPLGLAVFVWVMMLNALDLLPVDLFPVLWGKIVGATGEDPHHAYLRIVPTADLSVCMGLSVAVLLICLYYNVKIKGVGGWAHELVTAPFGTSKNPVLALVLGVCNFAMQIVEFISKTVSHGMRLFGNMYAGELIFLLIALMGGAWTFSGTGVAFALGQIVAGTAWAIFHILIITIQAFIFMMLALVYIGQAHDHH